MVKTYPACTTNIKPELIKYILKETEELIKIFVTSIKTAENKPRLGVAECSILDVCFSFDVGRSMFDVRRSSLKTTPYIINLTCEYLQNKLALMGLRSISAKLFLHRGIVEGLLKKMNIEHRTSNIEF